MKMNLLVWFSLFKLCLTTDDINKTKTLDIMAFVPMFGAGWIGGVVCLPAMEMAISDVNSRPDILADYKINMIWRNTMCDPGICTNVMYELLREEPTKKIIVGAGCSTESEATAQASHLWNMTQISYGSSSPTLSDRKRFPNFFRLAAPDTTLNPARISLLKYYGWKRVATIHQALDFFSAVTQDFLEQIRDTDIEIVTSEIFDNSPKNQIANIKKHDARIIMAACYADMAVRLLCEAYKAELYGKKIVWVFPGWFGNGWWLDHDRAGCSQRQIELAAAGHFVTGNFYLNPKDEIGIAGITSKQFTQLFRNIRNNVTYDEYEFVAGPCYDVIWAVALAFNRTVNVMEEKGYKKTLDEFTYADSDINDLITSSLYSTHFSGVKGDLAFSSNGDPISQANLQQLQGDSYILVGIYQPAFDGGSYEWMNGGIKWPGGHVPRDSTMVIRVTRYLGSTLYACMSGCSVLGIILSCCFLAFNIWNRNSREVKMSSPNINSILLFGCMITYSTVLLQSFDYQVGHVLCKIYIIWFSIGFSLIFGALFSKTWRVYKIFSNKKMLKMKIKDSQLLLIIAIILAIDCTIVIVWEILDPHYLISYRLPAEISPDDEDIEIHPSVHVCDSSYSTYLHLTIYIKQGMLLVFGAFLAWETRKVKIEALNDSRQIGMCLYNIVVLSAIGVIISLVLKRHQGLSYGLISGFTIIGTTLTQMIIFIPKILHIRHKTSVVGLSSARLSNSANIGIATLNSSSAPHES